MRGKVIGGTYYPTLRECLYPVIRFLACVICNTHTQLTIYQSALISVAVWVMALHVLKSKPAPQDHTCIYPIQDNDKKILGYGSIERCTVGGS
tara:strand:+ start:1212 stop:1490 length:279 start_codon:yes stop_codon:yes gene_type:complete